MYNVRVCVGHSIHIYNIYLGFTELITQRLHYSILLGDIFNETVIMYITYYFIFGILSNLLVNPFKNIQSSISVTSGVH